MNLHKITITQNGEGKIHFLLNFVERVTELLPDEAKQQIQSVLPKRDFEMVYRLDCRNLCADFQEDISFRFSLGITNLMGKLFGHRGPGLFARGYQTVSRKT